MQDLLDLAFDEPEAARQRAERLIATDSDPLVLSFAHQALTIVLREAGDTGWALREARAAVRAARRSGVPERLSDVRATYGGTLVFAGRTREGLKQLEDALDGATGEVGAKVRMRRAATLSQLGQHEAAAVEMRLALKEIARTPNRVWEARTLVWLGDIELRRGRLGEAQSAFAAAESMFEREGARLERLTATTNLAELAVVRGDLATALRIYAGVLDGYRDAGVAAWFHTVMDYARAYLAAGLPELAVDRLDQGVSAGALTPLDEAEFHLLRARALLETKDVNAALVSARRARDMFRRQHREWHRQRAVLILSQALSTHDRRRARAQLAEVLERLIEEHSDDAATALVLAGRLAEGPEAKVNVWRRATPLRRHPNGVVRAGARVAQALERTEVEDRAGVLRACSAGLDAIDEHRRLLGSSELRALATTHGRELTTIALRHAAHDPRTLLRWSERTRATALAQPPATSDAATIPESLAALRDNGRKLAEARQAGEPTEQLERERLRLERAVRSEHHTLSATADEAQRPASAEEVVAGVGDGCLVELVDVDGVLHVLVVHDGRVRRRVAGTTAEAAELLGPTAMLLRRASRGRTASTADLGRRLQETILGDAARLIPDGPVELAPTARLHGLPWALLPALGDRPFSVVPSAGQYLRARSVRRPRARRTVLVAGPALESGGAEVPVLAQRLEHAELLDGRAATLENVLERIDGADLVHLAAHGRFRADSPLFSALDLADGPLTVHDLERVRRAPYRVVLSACESGVLAPVGAGELLGLAAALFSLGSAGLVCSVAEVNDAATAELMVGLHDGLARGLDPAAALCDVRLQATEPVLAATAASFVALGV